MKCVQPPGFNMLRSVVNAATYSQEAQLLARSLQHHLHLDKREGGQDIGSCEVMCQHRWKKKNRWLKTNKLDMFDVLM